MHKLEDSFNPTTRRESQRNEVINALKKELNNALTSISMLSNAEEVEALEAKALATYNEWRNLKVSDLKNLIWTGHEAESTVATFVGAIIMFLKFEFDDETGKYDVDYLDLATLQYELFA